MFSTHIETGLKVSPSAAYCRHFDDNVILCAAITLPAGERRAEEQHNTVGLRHVKRAFIWLKKTAQRLYGLVFPIRNKTVVS